MAFKVLLEKNPMITFIRIVAVLTLSCIIALPIISLADAAQVRGIYSLMKGMQPVEQSALKLPFIAGVSIRASWEAIQPEEERFDWNYLDSVLQEVKKANKKAMLRILPGTHSPDWVYKKGVAVIEFKDPNPHHKTFGEVRKIPLPWDETYLKLWTNFVRELGKRYAFNTSIVLVHMAGPTLSSAEMHLPKKGSVRRLIQEAGYSKETLISAWKKVIDAYAVAFPASSLALNISIPFRNDGAMEEIIKYGISRLGQRLCIQGNWLSAHTMDSFHPYKVMHDLYKNKAVNVGFQMLGAAKNESRQGSLDTAIQKGLNAGANYFEIYEIDIIDNRNRQLLEELDRRLK